MADGLTLKEGTFGNNLPIDAALLPRRPKISAGNPLPNPPIRQQPLPSTRCEVMSTFTSRKIYLPFQLYVEMDPTYLSQNLSNTAHWYRTGKPQIILTMYHVLRFKFLGVPLGIRPRIRGQIPLKEPTFLLVLDASESKLGCVKFIR